MKHKKIVALLAAAGMFVAGCQDRTGTGAPTSPAAAPAGPALKPIASVIDIMAGQVDPAADFLWESVATVSTPKGMVEHRPRTDDEWLAVRMKALQLAEAANLLMVPGRRLAHEGQHLDDEGAQGNLTAAQAQEAIEKDHDAFVGFATLLRDTAEHMLTTIDKRDVDAFLEVGGTLDEVCEQCHLKFWYPGSPPPPTAMRRPVHGVLLSAATTP